MDEVTLEESDANTPSEILETPNVARRSRNNAEILIAMQNQRRREPRARTGSEE